jgi:hypothetical protein
MADFLSNDKVYLKSNDRVLLILMSSFKWYYMHVSWMLVVGAVVENIIIKN